MPLAYAAISVAAEAGPKQRALGALETLRGLLGPDPLVASEDEPDRAELEQLVDGALDELRRIVPDYTGPEASRLAAVALDLADVRHELASDRAARRLDGVVQVQRALAQLRAIGSTEQMLLKAPEAVCEHCGFQMAILWRVDEGIATPAAAYSKRDDAWAEKVRRTASARDPIRLESMPLESNMFRRRRPLIVRDALNDSRVLTELTQLSGIDSYVAAPVMPEGRVIGFLHATTMADDDILDRDVLWAFAEGYGYALERTILLQRMHDQGGRMRELVRATEEALTEMREAGLEITSVSQGLQAVEAEPVRAAIFSAPDSRIHQLLTRRELEVIELLAAGETNKQIAERIVVSEGTVKSHVSQILRKLHAANRAEAVSKYMRLTDR